SCKTVGTALSQASLDAVAHSTERHPGAFAVSPINIVANQMAAKRQRHTPYEPDGKRRLGVFGCHSGALARRVTSIQFDHRNPGISGYTSSAFLSGSRREVCPAYVCNRIDASGK